jgi:hypothetical protein
MESEGPRTGIEAAASLARQVESFIDEVDKLGPTATGLAAHHPVDDATRAGDVYVIATADRPVGEKTARYLMAYLTAYGLGLDVLDDPIRTVAGLTPGHPGIRIERRPNDPDTALVVKDEFLDIAWSLLPPPQVVGKHQHRRMPETTQNDAAGHLLHAMMDLYPGESSAKGRFDAAPDILQSPLRASDPEDPGQDD